MSCKTRLPAMMRMACSFVLAATVHRAEAGNGPEKIAIRLERTACLGSCPVYVVTIQGDGRVHFTTGTTPVDGVDELHRRFTRSNGVLLPGTHEDQVDPAAVKALVRQFEQADFWHLKDEYRYPATDSSTQVVTLTVGGRKKTVTDYMGTEAGMPRVAKDLEAAIDHLAGTDRWVKGSPGLIPWLEQNGFDFHSKDASRLVLDGESFKADQVTVVAFIDRGAPLDQPVLLPDGVAGRSEVTGVFLMEDSIRRGHADVFTRLAKDGWLARIGERRAAQIFTEEAAGCSPALVDAVADAGVDIDRPEVRKKGDSDDDVYGGTALSNLMKTFGCDYNETTRVQTARRLLDRGADPNHRDSLGRTPLYDVENLELLNLLLAHGADATARSKNGRSVVFNHWDDAMVLRLLQAGASPVGKYEDGKTLAQQARAGDMPLVARWLAAHPDALRRK